jgi:hypothetical protein
MLNLRHKGKFSSVVVNNQIVAVSQIQYRVDGAKECVVKYGSKQRF